MIMYEAEVDRARDTDARQLGMQARQRGRREQWPINHRLMYENADQRTAQMQLGRSHSQAWQVVARATVTATATKVTRLTRGRSRSRTVWGLNCQKCLQILTASG